VRDNDYSVKPAQETRTPTTSTCVEYACNFVTPVEYTYTKKNTTPVILIWGKT
jgi:hypothetical protein